MTRIISLLALLVMPTIGCSGSQSQIGSTSSVAATEMTQQMVGQWGIDGEVVLTIQINRDRVIVSSPENDTWRMDISDAKIVDDSIHFIQKNYLRNGEHHPFNGVACNSIVKMVDDNKLELGLTTVHTPEYEMEILTRIK